jgi:hypothetical protein
MLGYRGIAIAFDDVYLDAARFQFADIHVARRTGAQEHDVLELRALCHQRRRHVGMVVDGDIIAADHAWQILARERLAVNVDFRIVRLDHARPNRRELVVAIEKDGFHGVPALTAPRAKNTCSGRRLSRSITPNRRWFHAARNRAQPTEIFDETCKL